MGKPRYRRVLVKLSGEALMGDQPSGLASADARPHRRRSRQGQEARRRRSPSWSAAATFPARRALRGDRHRPRHRRPHGHAGDRDERAGARGGARESRGAARARCRRSPCRACASPVRASARCKHLAAGRIVVLAGGTGNPFFTTDTGATLRAAELGCQAVFKATNVDGVYDADPKRNPKAKRFDQLSHDEALARDLKVMDAAAFALARENRLAYHRVLDPRKGRDFRRNTRRGKGDARSRHKRVTVCARSDPILDEVNHGRCNLRPQRYQAPHAGRGRRAEDGTRRAAHRARFRAPARSGRRRGLWTEDAAQSGRHRQRAGAAPDLGPGLGQFERARRSRRRSATPISASVRRPRAR